MEEMKKAGKAERGNRVFSILAGVLLSFSVIGAFCSLVMYLVTFIFGDIRFYVSYMGWGWTLLKVILPFVENEMISLFNILLFTALAVLVFCNRKTAFAGVLTILPAVVAVSSAISAIVIPLLEMILFSAKGTPVTWLIIGQNVASKLILAAVWVLLAVMLLLQSKRGAGEKQKWMRFVCFIPAVLFGLNAILGEIVVVVVGWLLDVSIGASLFGVHVGSTVLTSLLHLAISLPSALPILFFGIWIVSSPRKPKAGSHEGREAVDLTDAQ